MGRFLYQLFKIIRSISSKSRRQWQAIYQHKYANTSTELRIELHSRLRLDIILDFPPLERLNCLEAVKKLSPRTKMARMVFRFYVNEVALVNCNLSNSAYLHDSRVSYIFTTNKLFGSLMNILNPCIFNA